MNDFESTLLLKIETLIKLVAINGLHDKTFREKVQVLSSVGLEPKEIAIILNKKPNHISVTLNELKKGNTKDGKQ